MATQFIADALMFAAGGGFGAGITAAIAGETPEQFFGLSTQKVAFIAAVAGIIAGIGWSMVFFPGLAVASGGLLGSAFIAQYATADAEGFKAMNPTRIAVAALLVGGAATGAWFFF